MWTLSAYRSARELVSVLQDVRQLYEMAAEANKQRESAPPEVELTTRFRECCACVDDPEPLFFTEAEPYDCGWTVIDPAG